MKNTKLVAFFIAFSLIFWLLGNATEPKKIKMPVPVVDGDWWQIASTPDLGNLNKPGQEPVDFGIWQAADGTWQAWSCIRNTAAKGHTRLFYRWEGNGLNTQYVSDNPMFFGTGNDDTHLIQQLNISAPEIIEFNGEYYMDTLNPNLDGIRIVKLK